MVAQSTVLERQPVESDLPSRAEMKILVAEDSSITQDLIKLVLGQHGHDVKIVDDGEQALEALKANHFDLVLLDFHLPKLDGVSVLSSLLSSMSTRPQTCFVAITADIEGLLASASNCENFDKIIAKPLNIEEVLSIIEELKQGDFTPLSQGFDQIGDEEKIPENAGKSLALRSGIASVTERFRFLRWPEDFDPVNGIARSLQKVSSEATFDGLLVEEAASVADLAPIWAIDGLHLLPIIDVTGSLGSAVDVDASKISAFSSGAIDNVLEAFARRRTFVHRDLRRSQTLSDKLLSRIFVSDGLLQPIYSSKAVEGIAYNVALSSASVLEEANKLLKTGLLYSSFFDRFSVCDACGSSHFNVREVCPQCKSADLKEENYIHHFKCAHQAPQSDFARGDELVCPKCSQRLLHFGSDYDKPGTLVCCQSCGHSTSEPDVSFVCLDCGSLTSGDAVNTRNVYRYSLSEDGNDYIKTGHSYSATSDMTRRFSDIPLEIVVLLNDASKSFNEHGVEFCLLEIDYQNILQLSHELGPRQVMQLREMFLANLRNFFVRNLGEGVSKVTQGHAFDFALLQDASPDDVRAALGDLISVASNHLRHDLGARIAVFGPTDLFR